MTDKKIFLVKEGYWLDESFFDHVNEKQNDIVELSKALEEKIAELEHNQWWSWSEKLSRDIEIPELVKERWEQCWKPYSELTEEQKEEDRFWARKVFQKLKESM